MAKKLSPMEQKSSKTVLDELRKQTQGMLKGKMDGLKKVTVASDSKEGLSKGLDLAKKIAGHPMEEGSDAEEASESPEMEASEDASDEASESPEQEYGEESDGSEISPEEEAMSAEQLDNHIRCLQALKFKKK